MESKKAIYDLIPGEYYPATLFFKSGTDASQVIQEIKSRNLHYPLIAKPDIGMQGLAVQKLEDNQALQQYILSSKVDFLIQDFVDYENEIGIFYYRYPNERKGHISGIVKKELLTVCGDGISTIETLLRNNKRFILQLPALRKVYGSLLEKILSPGEKQLLVPYGNHARGAKFIDISHLVDDKLTDVIDTMCRSIDGFFFGRLDVRYAAWDELREGRNFSIIELNGAGSEPTHIYDPKHTIFFAWKEIIRHWNILSRISRLNHQNKNIPYLNFKGGMQMFSDNKEYIKLITETQSIRA